MTVRDGVQVGSGTDPGEGAALAGALLDKLADTAGLTYATTHHAQLKDRPVSPHVTLLAGLPQVVCMPSQPLCPAAGLFVHVSLVAEVHAVMSRAED